MRDREQQSLVMWVTLASSVAATMRGRARRLREGPSLTGTAAARAWEDAAMLVEERFSVQEAGDCIEVLFREMREDLLSDLPVDPSPVDDSLPF